MAPFLDLPTPRSCGRASDDAPPVVTTDGPRTVVGSRILAVVLVFLVAACGEPLVSHVIGGSFILKDSDVRYTVTTTKTTCVGTGGYSDIQEGLGVVVRDGDGKVLATSALELDVAESSRSRCAYVFAAPVPDVPFYEIEVGHRGTLTYSNAELEARIWLVSFTLGG